MGNKSISKPIGELQDECIRVPKVYDWVTDALKKEVEVRFTDEQLEKIEEALEDPHRRPLRITVKTPKIPPLFPLGGDSEGTAGEGFYCEQIGEKRQVTVSVSGKLVEAELVDLLFTSDISVLVLDRQGKTIVQQQTNVSILESFVLCYPDGTDLLCRVSKIWSRVSGGSLILNGPFKPTVKLEVILCVDVQVEAEVKLEVLAKYSDPRGNDIKPPKEEEHCPPPSFPGQRPAIYPGYLKTDEDETEESES
ncbi:hypothetical protein OYT88_01665 [Sporolactobacillus sp. CQH2019]|uniref:hypothetical protein n=1 Tax=Sporolactobacillus sp. CQH2019 TaxID=3023512 RepID=UPI0023680A7E|nr:hypothetical protein [Sporolactobacillus sp. CQH2019]MDD9147256.1 hypothetical protein [Sporolactobacillus sp. CQH2019]